MTLQGKIAVVTGASRGIGQGVAVALAEAGAKVYCVSTKDGGCAGTVELCRERDGQAVAVAADVSSQESVDALAKHVLDAESRVDILVNNAGITKDGVFLRMSPEDLDAVMAVNMRGPFLTCRAFARGMAKARSGRIVNVGSVVGAMGNAGQTNYAASKAAIVGFSKSLARELAARGVTVNVVAPGLIATDMTASIPDEIQDQMLKNVPLGRLGSAQDVAGAVRFLCSDAAAYITGHVLVVDGGMAM